jgi:hypothetical protein
MKKTLSTVCSFITSLKEKIESLFDACCLETIAKETKFMVRSTNRINPRDFVQLMVLELLENPSMSIQGLCDILALLNPRSHMSANALQQRLASDGAADFLETVFNEAMTRSLVDSFEKTAPELLVPFNRVWLQDSTQCQLSEKLAPGFRGAGGSGSQSALKLSLIYEHQQRTLHQILMTDGKTAETALGKVLLDRLEPHDLVIRDLGYFVVEALFQIAQKGAFFLSRLNKGIAVFLTAEPKAAAIDLPMFVNQRFTSESVIDLPIYLGRQKLAVRLIGYRAPSEVVNQRRRKAREVARKKGRQPSKAYLDWLAFSFYLTNVSKEKWEAKVVGTIYRLRWQIELIFKQWKSLLHIDCLKGTNPNRIRCLVYGRLIAIVICSMIYRGLCCYAYAVWDREPSIIKLTAWLITRRRLADALEQDALESLFSALQTSAKRLLKQQRLRRTTVGLILQQVPFLHGF